MTYSVDFRQKVLSIREQEGLSIKETATRFHIGTDSVTRWLKRIEPQQKSVPRRRKLDKAALVNDVERYPDAYQRERAARFGVSKNAIWQALKNLGISCKKNATPSQSRRNRPARVPRKNSGL